MPLTYSHWAPADRVAEVEAHVRAHLSSVAAEDDSPSAYADAVRISRTEDDGGVLVTGELDAEPAAPYLRPGWTPEPEGPSLGPPGQGAAAGVARCEAINARLRAAGITVREAPGWKTRGNGQTAAYEGGLVHHTATGFGTALPGSGPGRLLMDGRPDLSGPLCNYAGNEDGSVTVIAAHPANHAGASGGRSMGPLPVTSLFNRRVLGLEVVYPGTSAMRPAQYRTAVAWAKAVAEVCGGGDIERVRAHAETSITGKWDPGHAPGRTVDMTAFRNAADNQEDDLTPEERGWLKFVHDRVAGAMPQRYYVPDPKSPAGIREVPPGAAGARPAHVLDTLDGNFLVRQLAPLADDEAKVLAAVDRLRDAFGDGSRSPTGKHLDQLAEAIAGQLTDAQVDDFVTRLRSAASRPGNTTS